MGSTQQQLEAMKAYLKRWPNFHQISLGKEWNQMWSYLSDHQIRQQTKNITQPPAGLLQPLSIPKNIWNALMDFIAHLPLCKGNNTMYVVVDRFSAAAHFGMPPFQFTASLMADLFSTIVCKIAWFT